MCVSVKNNVGLDEIRRAVYDFVGMDKLNSGEVFVSGQRQFDIILRAIAVLDEAKEAIEMDVTLDAVTVLIQNALDILAELTGENASEEVINMVFSKFCLGK